MGRSLNPSPSQRALHGWRPDWTRTLAARRALAAGLVMLAAASALRDDPGGGSVSVVVASRDLPPGSALTGGDVRIEQRRDADVPDGSVGRIDAAVGSTLTGPARRGEVLTDVRLLGSRLADAAAGPDARVVALPLADPALLDLLRAGDVIDIVAAPEAAETADAARVIATGAVVVLVSGERSGGIARQGGRVVLVALPAPAAKTVAGAALVQAITVTLH